MESPVPESVPPAPSPQAAEPHAAPPPQTGGARVTVEQQVTRDLTLTYVTTTASSQQRLIQFEWVINERMALVGARDHDATKALLRAVYAAPLPNAIVSVMAGGAALPPSHPAHGKGLVDRVRALPGVLRLLLTSDRPAQARTMNRARMRGTTSDD